MRTGDVVFHRPTGETWVLACVDEARGEVVPCGWPMCFARIADCEVTKSASDEESDALLLELAEMHSDDHRKRWALRLLAARAEAVLAKLGGA